MLGTEPRRLERYAHNLQRAIRAPDHGPLHRRWVANRTADATSIRPKIPQPPRQSDSPDPENPLRPAAIRPSAGPAGLPPTIQIWQYCTDVCGRPYVPAISIRNHRAPRIEMAGTSPAMTNNRVGVNRPMSTLATPAVSGLLERLFAAADQNDPAGFGRARDAMARLGKPPSDRERAELMRDVYMPVSPA